jgi:hypothetical protein
MSDEPIRAAKRDYVPAAPQLWLYDFLVAVLTRESRWRPSAGLAAMCAALVPGGELHVADYGLQRTALMRRLFRVVGAGDGYENTEPNARGVLPELMKEVGLRRVEETAVIPTPTGSISLYQAERGA